MSSFKQKVINTWGNMGEKWLQNLPNIIKTLSDHWSLSKIMPVKNMSYNYIALAVQKNNHPVVLKISCDKQLIQDEYNALMHFNGNGAVRVLDAHMDLNSLLLEQAIPGIILKENYLDNIENTITI